MNSHGEERALFVVSQPGQIKHAEALLRHLGIPSATAAVLYTEKNGRTPQQVIEAVDPSIFTRTDLVKIHPESNQLRKDALRFNRRVYSEMLDLLRPTHLFVCSYERHYALLCEIAAKRGISINLFEEGAGSFKGLVADYESFPLPKFTVAVDRILNRIWAKTRLYKFILRPIYRWLLKPVGGALFEMVMIPKRIFDTVMETKNLPHFQAKGLIEREKNYVSGWKSFDAVYTSNPEVMKKIHKANSFVEVHANFDDEATIARTREIIDTFAIDHNTAIFTSQQYGVNKQRFAESVVRCLHKIATKTGWRILIKLHPKELGQVAAYYENAAAEYSDIKVMACENIPGAEYLAVHSECASVIGISSSTLIYAPKAKPSLRAITIGRELIEIFNSAGITSPGVQLISEHIKIMPHIPYIEDSLEMDFSLHLASDESPLTTSHLNIER